MDSREILLARFSHLYASLDESSLTLLPEVYHREIHFVDPVGEHRGLSALDTYFRKLLGNLNSCCLILTEVQHTHQEASICWQMNYSHPRLHRGRVLNIQGISQLRFAEQRIIYQRDYYDLGAMLYEHLPLLGNVILRIKRRLQS